MHFFRPVAIFLLTLLAYVSFAPQNPQNAQNVTRTALAVSLSEGRVDIDRHARFTVDKAFFEGHYYADKPPGLSLLAVPAIIVTRAWLTATGQDSDPLSHSGFVAYLTASTVLVVSLLGAMASALVYAVSRRLGASDAGALFAGCALAIGTPFFGWSTAFFSHSVTGSLLLIGFALVVCDRGQGRSWTAPVLGLLLGFVAIVDFTSVFAAALVGGLYLLDNKARFWPATIWLGAGGLVGLAPLFIYNAIAFHSPFRLGYSAVVGFNGMQEGLFGLTSPDFAVLWEILFGLYRGLLPLSPVLILVPLGLARMAEDQTRRGPAWVIAGTVAITVLINISYYYWNGGNSTGPRMLVGMLPIAAVALAFAWPKTSWGRAVSIALLVISVLVSGVCASTTMFVRDRFMVPFFETLLPSFLTPGGLFRAVPLGLVWCGFVVMLLWREPAGSERL